MFIAFLSEGNSFDLIRAKTCQFKICLHLYYLNVQEGRNISLNGLVFKCNDGHIINDILNLITVNFVLV